MSSIKPGENKELLGNSWVTYWRLADIIDSAISWFRWETKSKIEFTPEFLRSVIETSPTLNDVFFVNNEWTIEVKSVEESNILKWHFWFLALVPWVVLKELFRKVSGKEWISSLTEFLWMVVPWDKLKITENWIEKIDQAPVISYKELTYEGIVDSWVVIINWVEINENAFLLGSEYSKKIHFWQEIKLWTQEELDELVMQREPFRFVDEAKVFFDKKWELTSGDIVYWSFTVPESFPYVKDWVVPTELYDEISAQILSFWASYVMWNSDIKSNPNLKDISSIQELEITQEQARTLLGEEKLKSWLSQEQIKTLLSQEQVEQLIREENKKREQKREQKFQTFIFKSSNVRNFTNVTPWKKLICRWVVWEVKGRDVKIYFTLTLEDWTKVQMWEITWQIWSRAILARWSGRKTWAKK